MFAKLCLSKSESLSQRLDIFFRPIHFDSLSVHPRIAREGPAEIRAALKEHIAVLRRQAAIKLREALKLEKVSDEVFEVAWPGYWVEEQASKLYYVK